ncbi:MAG: polymer-forming cytoskeletal protein [Myxococcales bacterium]
MALWGKKPEQGTPAAIADESPVLLEKPVSNTRELKMAMLKREEETLRGGDVNAVLGRGTEFEGKLTFEGEVRIAGKFTGEIFSKDRLQIDDGARIKAEINAGTVVVYGEVTGNIKALQMVELKATARVRGNIETPSLVIEKGVIFEGQCKMENLGKGGGNVTPLLEKK